MVTDRAASTPFDAPAARRRPVLSGRRVLVAMLGLLVVAIGILITTYVTREPDPKLDVIGTVPEFTLVDETNTVFTEEALRGHPTIINFIFTRCDTICPVIAMKTQRLQEKTADRKGVAIKLLSISVDPAHDTPEKLAEFAERHGADPTRWRFVTGPADKVRALVTGPLMNAMDPGATSASGVPQVVHGGWFLLVDGDLRIRGVYDSNDIQRLDELIWHARFLARTGGGRSYKFGGS